MVAVEKMDNTEILQRFERADEYNRSLAEGNINKALSVALNGKENIMCYVEIPSLSIYLPVYYGTSDEVLKKGCGWLENTSLPVGGINTHSVISGHTGLPNAEMFTKLDNIKKDDVFYIYVYDRVLAYKVVTIDTVTPEHTELLTIVPDKDYLTLLTCTPYGINDRRLLVKGERVVTSPQEKEEEASPQHSSVSAPDEADRELTAQIRHEFLYIMLITAAAVVVFTAACIWLSITVRRRSSGKYACDNKRLEEDNAEEKEE